MPPTPVKTQDPWVCLSVKGRDFSFLSLARMAVVKHLPLCCIEVLRFYLIADARLQPEQLPKKCDAQVSDGLQCTPRGVQKNLLGQALK